MSDYADYKISVKFADRKDKKGKRSLTWDARDIRTVTTVTGGPETNPRVRTLPGTGTPSHERTTLRGKQLEHYRSVERTQQHVYRERVCLGCGRMFIYHNATNIECPNCSETPILPMQQR